MTNFFSGSATSYNGGLNYSGPSANNNNNNNAVQASNSPAPASPVSSGLTALFNVFTDAFGDNPLVSFKNSTSLTNDNPPDEGSDRQKVFTA